MEPAGGQGEWSNWTAGELAGRIPPVGAGVESRANGTESGVSPSPAAVSHQPAPVSPLVAERSHLAAAGLRIGFDPVCPRLVGAGCPACSRLGGRIVAWARGGEKRFGPICPRLRRLPQLIRLGLCPECSRFGVRCIPVCPICPRFVVLAGEWGRPSLCPKCSRFAVPLPIRDDRGGSGTVGRRRSGRSAGIRDTGAGNSYTSAAKRDTALGGDSLPSVASIRHQPLSWRLARRDEP